MYELSAQQYAFLRELDGRHSFEQALDAAAHAFGLRPVVEAARDWLCDWACKGFFETV